jgi:hypothetical protein
MTAHTIIAAMATLALILLITLVSTKAPITSLRIRRVNGTHVNQHTAAKPVVLGKIEQGFSRRETCGRRGRSPLGLLDAFCD